MKLFKYIFVLFLSVVLFNSCKSPLNTDDDYNKGYKQGFQDGFNSAKQSSNKTVNNITTDPNAKNDNNTNENRRDVNTSIPDKVYKTLDYIKINNRAPDGYVGGRHFGNFEHHLPERDAAGNTIDYKEYDVNPKVDGKNRGTQRLVIGNDGSAWYTSDHYNTFVEVK